jgi:hypothetical protein
MGTTNSHNHRDLEGRQGEREGRGREGAREGRTPAIGGSRSPESVSKTARRRAIKASGETARLES